MNEKHRKLVLAASLILFAFFLCAVGWFVGRPMIALAGDAEAFRAWVDSSGAWGMVLFVGMVALQIVVAFIPGEPIELAAGYAFGFWKGTALTMVGFLIGSWLVFSLVRKFGVKLVEVFFPRSKIAGLRFLRDTRKTRLLAFIIMLIPGTPKDLISYFAGLTQLTLWQWLGIVLIARIPSLVTSTLAGAAAGEEDYLLSGIVLAVTLVISAAGIWYYRQLCIEEQKKAARGE